MSRMYDNVLARGKRAYMGEGRYCEPVPTECLEDATVVWAENAAAYFYATADKAWDLTKDFPTLAPPFKNFFVEYNAPKGGDGPQAVRVGDWEVPLWQEDLRGYPGLRGSAPENSPGGFGDKWGFLFSSVDLLKEAEGPSAGRPELTMVPESSPERIRAAYRADPTAPEAFRWLVDVVSFIGAKGRAPVGPFLWWRLSLSPSGQIARLPPSPGLPEGGPGIRASYAAATAGFGGEFSGYRFAASVSGMLLPALFAVSLMNCKNVNLDPQEPPEKLSKNFRRKYGKPLSRYHLLEVEPMKAVLNSEGKAGEEGLKKALHLCRGHFKTYGPDKKLFGKHEGTYWWPQHVRGSSGSGEVKKDYAVKAPRDRPSRTSSLGAPPEHPPALPRTDAHSGARPPEGQTDQAEQGEGPGRGLLGRLRRLIGGTPGQGKPDDRGGMDRG